MANKGTQEGQCQPGTADLADAVLDCLSTGMKIPVVYVFIVVFSSAISAVSAAPFISGSLEVPEHPVHPVSSPPPKVQKWWWR